MRKNTALKRNVMNLVAGTAFLIGKTTAMSISRLGVYESPYDEKANEILVEKRNKNKK